MGNTTNNEYLIKCLSVLPINDILNHWETVDRQFLNYNFVDINKLETYFDENKPLNILEIGTKRSNPDISTHHKNFFKNINKYVMMDVENGIDVDVVCDVHKLSSKFNEEFDIIISFSGYEHFKYPQLASHEILKCLKKNGIVFIQTHQTFPLHGYPNDYFRFSIDALESLFPKTMGTEILAKSYSEPCSIIPFNPNCVHNLYAKCYCNSSIIVKKIKDTPNIFLYDI